MRADVDVFRFLIVSFFAERIEIEKTRRFRFFIFRDHVPSYMIKTRRGVIVCVH